MMIKKMLF